MILCENEQQFLSIAGAYLKSSETRHNLFYASLKQPGAVPHRDCGTHSARAPVLMVLGDQAHATGVAILTPAGGLIAAADSTQALVPLAHHLQTARTPLRGVLGPTETASAFAKLWTQRTGRLARLRVGLNLYELCAHTTPRRATASGQLRAARTDERDALVQWATAFDLEAHAEDSGTNPRTVDEALAEGRIFIWEHQGRAVSMATWSGPTPSGVRLNMVYTPPGERGRGFAAACVAELSQNWFMRGKERVFLFADHANSSSNRLYQRLGFTRVCGFADYSF